MHSGLKKSCKSTTECLKRNAALWRELHWYVAGETGSTCKTSILHFYLKGSSEITHKQFISAKWALLAFEAMGAPIHDYICWWYDIHAELQVLQKR